MSKDGQISCPQRDREAPSILASPPESLLQPRNRSLSSNPPTWPVAPPPSGASPTLSLHLSFLIPSLQGKPYPAMPSTMSPPKTLSSSPTALGNVSDGLLTFIHLFIPSCIYSFQNYLLPWGYSSTKTGTVSVTMELLI